MPLALSPVTYQVDGFSALPARGLKKIVCLYFGQVLTTLCLATLPLFSSVIGLTGGLSPIALLCLRSSFSIQITAKAFRFTPRGRFLFTIFAVVKPFLVV